MRKRIFRNWGLKIASLLLACILWFLVVAINDPKETRTFSNIPVTLVNTELLEEGNKVYEVLDNTNRVRVSVRAPKSVINDIQASDIIAEADMSRLTDINTIPITYSILNAGSEYTIEGIPSSSVVRLNVDEKASKLVRVSCATTGEPAEGYMVGKIQLDLNRIEVTGPQTAVEKISYAQISVDVSGASSDMSLNGDILLYDTEDNRLDLPSVKLSEAHVHVSVPVLALKEVPLQLGQMGAPADGFLETGVVTCEPSRVMLAGTSHALSQVARVSIPPEVLDISGATENVVKVINIKEYLPDNVSLADATFNGNITVTIHIEPEVTRNLEIPGSRLSISNVPEGFEAQQIDPEETYMLRISGLEAAVRAVSAESLTGNVDIAAWMAGEDMEELEAGLYTIPISFPLPDNVVVEQQPEVRITIVKQNEGEDL